MSIDRLRRAANALRDPYLCNWDRDLAHAIADWLTDVAELQAIADRGHDEVSGLNHAVGVAAAFLRSTGQLNAEPARSDECPDGWHRNDVLDKPCPECGEEVQAAWVWYDNPPATTREDSPDDHH